jgi:hypothetical protein
VIDTAERTLLEESFRNALTDATTAGECNVDTALARLGWLDLLAAEPSIAIDVVFGALGACNATAGALDDVIVRALGLEPRFSRAACLPPFAAWSAPGREGLASARVVAADEIVVAAADGTVIAVPIARARVTAVRGMDPSAGLHTIELDAAAGEIVARDTHWADAVALARRALAHEILGASRTMLALARAHALDRRQFGRPIARFQAVRHRLADALIAIEALDAALSAAADAPGPQTAALAKAVAGRTARTVAAHCQQVLAGVGFTTDHPFHRSLKRTIVLDGLFGAGDDLTRVIGRELVAARTVPTVIEL